jgi:hypothetical protein
MGSYGPNLTLAGDTINAVAGYSHVFIVHGREARRPTDQWMKDYLDQLHDRTLAEYILELQQVILDAWEIAADRKMHAQGHIQQNPSNPTSAPIQTR